MFKKEDLCAGMIVELHNGSIAIVAHYLNNNKKLVLSWNDKSGRVLFLDGYSNDLTYFHLGQRRPEYDIDKVYDLGSCIAPFEMDVSKRSLLWCKDNKNRFSKVEKANAMSLSTMLNMFYEFKDEIPIKRMPRDKVLIGDDEVNIIIPEKSFPNLNEPTTLEAIINGEVLR